MSTHVYESVVIKAPIDKVWEQIRNAEFKFWSLVASSSRSGVEGQVGGTVTLTFKDATEQVIQVVQLSDIEHKLTYDLISSVPSVNVMSALHTIQLYHITSDNTTFVEWVSDFSGDASVAVTQDSRYKKVDAFADLQKMF